MRMSVNMFSVLRFPLIGCQHLSTSSQHYLHPFIGCGKKRLISNRSLGKCTLLRHSGLELKKKITSMFLLFPELELLFCSGCSFSEPSHIKCHRHSLRDIPCDPRKVACCSLVSPLPFQVCLWPLTALMVLWCLQIYDCISARFSSCFDSVYGVRLADCCSLLSPIYNLPL